MPNDLDQIVICTEDCEGCEHNRPHKYSSCQSSCDGGGDYQCPACVLAKKVSKEDEDQFQLPDEYFECERLNNAFRSCMRASVNERNA